MRTAKALSAAAIVLCATPAFAATLTVTSTSDSSDPGSGSLRAAIAAAANGDTINFNLGGPATITVGTPLTLGPNVTISGPGAANLTISGGDSVVVFLVNVGANVAISGLTVSHGSNLLGGGIFNAGTLALTDVVVSDNTIGTQLGGGIFNSGALTLTGCTVANNAVTFISRSGGESGDGGGVYNTGGTVQVIDSIIRANNALTGFGGGIANILGTVTVIDSTIDGNNSLEGAGIGSGSGTLVVSGSTFAFNIAINDGGGIVNVTLVIGEHPLGVAFVTNSTFFGNRANLGAALANDFAEMNVANTTITGNATPEGGFAINSIVSNIPPRGLFIKSTLLANNVGGNCFSIDTTSEGYNLSDDTSCATIFTATGDRNNVAAGLDAGGLKSNGGPTQTVALLLSSPAVNHIPVAACTDSNGAAVAVDQRGVTRPQGSACDVGAFELFASKFPSQAVAVYRIVDAVGALNLPGTVQQSLNDPLQSTITALNAGRTKTAGNTLAAFINQTDSRVKDGSLTAAQAAPLTTAAQAVLQNL
jgi:hypothetical protein